MEHEVFVPVPAERLREALADPARVARAVPGLQQDAGAAPGSGRLKVRVGSHSVTYRGTVRVSGQADGSYAVDGDASETRGTGSVKLALTLRLRDTDGGSTLTFGGTASADGRVTELPADTVASAGVRLLTRFAENLGASAEDGREEVPETEPSRQGQRQGQGQGQGPEPEPSQPEPSQPEPSQSRPAPEAESALEAGPGAGTGAEPPGAAEPGDAGDLAARASGDPEPPAEAAHARRTMIGRSAEEVDHAPPRGRYAPVPAPQTVTPASTLRWAAPAAAVVVASAIVVGRALRRRR